MPSLKQFRSLYKEHAKVQSLLNKDDSELKPVPDNWLEFARLLRIKSGGKVIQFEPYEYQLAIINEFNNNQNSISVKSRQLGMSELVLSYILWKSCLENGATSLCVSLKSSDSSILAQRFRFMLKPLIDGGYIRMLSDSLLYVKLENYKGEAGEVFFRSGRGNSNPGVGIPSLAYLFFDEISAVDDAESAINYILPAMSMVEHRKTFLVATPRGREGYYPKRLQQVVPNIFDICKNISNGSDKPFQIYRDESTKTSVHIAHYSCHPLYGSLPPGEFLRQKVAEGMSEEKVEQEYNLNFDEVGDAFFAYDFVESLLEDEVPEDLEDSLIVFGMDSSGLTGNDSLCVSAIAISNDSEGNEVYYLIDMLRINKGDFNSALYEIRNFINKYDGSYAIEVEKNGHGKLYLDELVRMKLQGDLQIEGSSTTGMNKVSLYDRIRMLGQTGRFKIWYECKNRKVILKELLNFRIDGTSPINDDTVTAIAYGLVALNRFSENNYVNRRPS